MPNPLVGKGADIRKGLHRTKYAVYIADDTDVYALMPTAKIANGAEPAGTWTRLGRLKDDTITWNITDPEILDGLAGFQRSLKWQVIRRAEQIQLTLTFDEQDPDLIAAMTLGTAIVVTGGKRFVISTGALIDCKLLLVGLDEKDTTQKHFFFGKASIRFKLSNQDDFDGVEATVTAYDVSAVETIQFSFFD